MHETFWMDDPSRFSRVWFAWANTLFGELIIELAEQRPHLIFKDAVRCVPLADAADDITEEWCNANCFDGEGALAPACDPDTTFAVCECK